MMRSLFAGVSGLRNHQTKMDVIGNNIANVNTVGFKKSRVTFQEMLNQTLRGASSPQAGRGGTNPMQVGLGVTLGSIDVIHTPGSPQSTGKNTDLSIEGEGYFILTQGSDIFYTRAGNFDFDTNKNLISSTNGYKVQGIIADANGVIDPKGAIQNISLASFVSSPPLATTQVTISKNLNANDPATNPQWEVPITIFDEKGAAHELVYIFSKQANNQWSVNYSFDGTVNTDAAQECSVTFNTDGTFNTVTANNFTLTVPGGTADIIINNTNSFNNMTQYASDYTAVATYQDGYAKGDLQGITVDTSGVISGYFSNGQNRSLAQIAIANFANPSGLMKYGSNLFKKSNNSGEPDAGIPGLSGRGAIKPETLEMSNVDLSQEFVDMIITQRGFQANSRIITTTDEMLQELANLKR